MSNPYGPQSGASPYEQAQQNNPYAQQQPAAGQNPYAQAQQSNPYAQPAGEQNPSAPINPYAQQAAPSGGGSEWQPREQSETSAWGQPAADSAPQQEPSGDDGMQQIPLADEGATVLAPSSWKETQSTAPADDSTVLAPAEWSAQGQNSGSMVPPPAQEAAPQQPDSQPSVDPYAQPYGQASAQPYGQASAQPPADPYAQSAVQPYDQPSAQNPYGQQPGFGQQPAQDPYAQQSAQDPYAQPSAPYAEPGNPYAQQQFQQPMPGVMGQPAFGPDQNGMYPQGALPSQMDPQSERSSASMAHWLAIIIGFWAPLIVMLTSGDKSPWVKQHAKQSLNLELTVLIAYVIGYGLSFLIVPLLLVLVAWVFALVYHIQGAQKASRGETYKCPVAIQFFK